MLDRLQVLKTVLWASVGVLAAITVVRFTFGLGAVTNLSDVAPWGLWVAFDVMAGVALAAGGFVMAATVYVFGLERYRPCVRPAILTALLGYIAAAIGLLFDLGLPWNIWHPMIYWQHHSVLFEVGMCVMLYLTVLSLEFAPVVLEHPIFGHRHFQAALRVLRRLAIPLVIAGIVLSTLHQSSLGSLFLIAPFRVHPLWYSPLIWLLFLVSAVGLGLMTVMLEGLVAAYFLGHRIKVELMPGVGIAASIVLWLYVLLRLGDLSVRGVLPRALEGTWQSNLFLLEVIVAAILPATLLLFRNVRSSVKGMAWCALLTVAGMIGYRLNLSIATFARPQEQSYFPAWTEIAVSAGIVSCCALVFLFFVERLRVYDDPVSPCEAEPSHDAATLDDLMPAAQAAPRRYSLAAITAASITLLFLPLTGVEPAATPVFGPRATDGLRVPRPDGDFWALRLSAAPAPAADGFHDPVRLLTIDGNHRSPVVLFNHDGHVAREGGASSCAACHHLDLPLDHGTSCAECHRDMYEPSDLFDHQTHVEALDGNDGCTRCHSEASPTKDRASATACNECHEPAAGMSIVPPPAPRWRRAPGYMDAMHGLCITCHERRAQLRPVAFGDLLPRCDACHDADTERLLRIREPATTTAPESLHTGGGRSDR